MSRPPRVASQSGFVALATQGEDRGAHSPTVRLSSQRQGAWNTPPLITKTPPKTIFIPRTTVIMK